MNDKEYKIQKERVIAIRDRWHSLLGLGWWKISFYFCREQKDKTQPSSYSPKNINDEWTTVMDVSCDPYYLTASVNCYLQECALLNDEELEEIYLHEMMHVFLYPIKNKQKMDEEERVATTLARAFQWVKQGKKNDKKTI